MSEVKEAVLLLGMVYSNEMVPKIGQEYRDRVRCVALESLGYSVKTLDEKHADSILSHGKHCRANFTQPRRMLKSMASKWGSIQLDHIILDYFFSPVGWARVRWSDSFFTETLPELAKERILSIGGKIWLPNLQCIRESIDRFRVSIDQFYTVHPVANPMENPLFVATENACEELLLCPEGALTNQSQLQPILAQASFPFFALVLKKSDNSELMQQGVSSNDNDDHASKSLLMWEAIVATPQRIDHRKCLRVFTGGKDSIQSGPFLHAINEIRKKWSSTVDIHVEKLNTQELCANKWQPDQFVDWLLQSHVHFILGHVHQSLLNHNLLWDMEFAMQQFTRLKYHVGFPSGEQLKCPVFTQDKIKYINCLGELAIKTMTVPLTADGTYDPNYHASVQRLK